MCLGTHTPHTGENERRDAAGRVLHVRHRARRRRAGAARRAVPGALHAHAAPVVRRQARHDRARRRRARAARGARRRLHLVPRADAAQPRRDCPWQAAAVFVFPPFSHSLSPCPSTTVS